jgi:uncharacterized protein (DUF1330 family)
MIIFIMINASHSTEFRDITVRWYNSAEYQPLIKLRQGCTHATQDMFITLEGA